MLAMRKLTQAMPHSRAQDEVAHNDSTEDVQDMRTDQEKKQKSRRPASMRDTTPLLRCHFSVADMFVLVRHCFQAAEIESMAVSLVNGRVRVAATANQRQTYPYTEDRPSHLLRSRHYIRTNRWTTAMV